jgi:hypothetical protein
VVEVVASVVAFLVASVVTLLVASVVVVSQTILTTIVDSRIVYLIPDLLQPVLAEVASKT